MLGRKDYTPDELDHARSTIRVQLDAYKKLGALATATDPVAEAALQEFEPIFFNNLTLVLDRFFVDRLRLVTGKDTNPLNEVEMMCDSLMNNDGMLRGNSVIAYLADLSVLHGDLRPEEEPIEDFLAALHEWRGHKRAGPAA